jgi:hypothetical protein
MSPTHVLATALLFCSLSVAAPTQTPPPKEQANDTGRLQLSPEEQATAVQRWSERLEQMHIVVMRRLSGDNYHFRVDFVVPPDPALPRCDLVAVYGSRTTEKGTTFLPDQYQRSFKGSWETGDPVQLTFDLPKQYADGDQGWDLRFCVGTQSTCTPSPNLLELVAIQSADLNTLRRQGIDAFRQGDYARALRVFRQAITADPSDIVAYNVAANCSLQLKDYPSAIDSFKHALQLQPDEYHNVSGLVRAYTLAGMAPERDELRKHIADLEQAGKLPADFNYVFEAFDAGDKKVEVAVFPKIQGYYCERYRFKVFNSAGKQINCVTLESDELEQPLWAKEHPKEAAAGGRGFSLDGYASDSHSTYLFYSGEPPYEQVREEVKQILAGKVQAIAKTTYPRPQPIPGAN